MNCPVCKKEMWDNRATKKGKQPDYRCKDDNCKFQWDNTAKAYVASEYVTAVWEPKGQNKNTNTSGAGMELLQKIYDEVLEIKKVVVGEPTENVPTNTPHDTSNDLPISGGNPATEPEINVEDIPFN